MSEQGQVDGAIHRVADYARTHPNMIRIEPAYFPLVFAAYARRDVALGTGWTALRNSRYRVE